VLYVCSGFKYRTAVVAALGVSLNDLSPFLSLLVYNMTKLIYKLPSFLRGPLVVLFDPDWNCTGSFSVFGKDFSARADYVSIWRNDVMITESLPIPNSTRKFLRGPLVVLFDPDWNCTGSFSVKPCG
jgi:hypothetical protein